MFRNDLLGSELLRICRNIFIPLINKLNDIQLVFNS